MVTNKLPGPVRQRVRLAAFRSARRHLGISIQPAHLGSGAGKGCIERYFGSVSLAALAGVRLEDGLPASDASRRRQHPE